MEKFNEIDFGQELADQIDSEILLKVFQDAGRLMDEQDIPLVGRYFYNPKTGEIEKND